MLSKIFTPVLNLFRFHKKRIALYFAMVTVFLYFIFPFNDLSDLVTAKVSEATAGQIYVGFDKLDLALLPTPGLSLHNVLVDSSYFPELKAKYLSASPSILGLLTFKPGVTIRGEEILGGDLVLSTRGGDKTPAGKTKQKVELDFDNLKLSDLIGLLDAQVKLSGQASGHLYSQVDPEFGEQPTGTVTLNLNKVLLDESDLNLQGMPLRLPKINVNQVELAAKLDKGSLDISKLNIGKAGSDISAQVTGKVNYMLDKQGGTVISRPGSYDLNIKFQISEALKQKVGVYLTLLQQYQVAQNTYSLKIAGNGFYGPPTQISKGQ